MVCTRRCCTARMGAQTPREGDHGLAAPASAKTEPGFFISPPTSLNLAISPKPLRAAWAPSTLLLQQGGASYPEPSYSTVSVRAGGCWLSPQYIISETSSDFRTRKYTLGRRHFATTADMKGSQGVSYSTILLLNDKYHKKSPSQRQLTGRDDETLALSRQQPCAGLIACGLLFSVICWILEPSEKNQLCLFIHLYILNAFLKIT